jgi:hypothetical protein
MQPVEAFQYLLDNNMPIILSFPLEEEKGHIITGKGVCHIEKIHGSSRVTMGGFHPTRLLYHLGNCHSFFATFEMKGETYICAMERLNVTGLSIVADIPTSLRTSIGNF